VKFLFYCVRYYVFCKIELLNSLFVFVYLLIAWLFQLENLPLWLILLSGLFRSKAPLNIFKLELKSLLRCLHLALVSHSQWSPLYYNWQIFVSGTVFYRFDFSKRVELYESLWLIYLDFQTWGLLLTKGVLICKTSTTLLFIYPQVQNKGQTCLSKAL